MRFREFIEFLVPAIFASLLGVLIVSGLSGCASTAQELRQAQQERRELGYRNAILVDRYGNEVSEARLKACARGDREACGE